MNERAKGMNSRRSGASGILAALERVIQARLFHRVGRSHRSFWSTFGTSFGCLLPAIALLLALAVSPPAMAQNSLKALVSQFDKAYSAGDHAAAERAAKRMVSLARKRYGKRHFNYGLGLNYLAVATANLGRFGDAIPHYNAALRIYEKKLGRNHTGVADLRNNLGIAYDNVGQSGRAVPHYQRALAIYDKALKADHPSIASTLGNLANAYARLGRYQKALPVFERLLTNTEKAQGADSPETAQARDRVASMLHRLGQFDQATALYQATLPVYEKAFGSVAMQVGNAYNNQAEVRKSQGSYKEAIALFEKARKIFAEAQGAGHQNVGHVLNNQANVHSNIGENGKAAALYKQALAIYDTSLPADHPSIGNTLDNLGIIYSRQGRFGEAMPLIRRALQIKEKALGDQHPSVADTRNNLADTLREQGKFEESLALLSSVRKVYEKSYGPKHPRVAVALDNIGYAHFHLAQYARAIKFHSQALKIREKALGGSHTRVATSAINLANAHFFRGDYDKAVPLYDKARVILEQVRGLSDPKVAKIFGNMASVRSSQGRTEDALDLARKATGALTTARARAVASRADADDNRTEPLGSLYVQHIALAMEVGRKQKDKRPLLADEALQTAQRHGATTVSAALSQMAARFGTGDRALGQAVRKQQDLSSALQAVEKALVAEFTKPKSSRDGRASKDLRAKRRELEKQLTSVSARLDREFPSYGELVNPAPLTVKDIRGLLTEDEALIVYLFPKIKNADDAVAGEDGKNAENKKVGYVWAITRKGLRWRELAASLTDEALSKRIEEIRKTLQFDKLQDGKALFDLEKAHTLYKDLLGPVEDLIRTKKKLLIVPVGALTGLPFNVLVTEPPAVARPPVVSGYRDAAWLVRRHATAILPSVSSLRALRVFARAERAGKPFIGYGDPDFGSGEAGAAKGTRVVDLKTRSFSSFYKPGGQVDLRLLSESLPPLPDTADELRHVAGRLGADPSKIRLGTSATERDVKAARLEDYRVVYFATHGLVAGDLAKLGSTDAEPALALTVPSQASADDNGLLTASEIAQLRLNAEWVVLSACNTAAGDKPGAEALSGLAKSFIYAGARSLLVSHWPVASNAAVTLTSQIFDSRAEDADLGKAEALQRSMLALLQDDRDPINAYPAVWAPFIVVGD